MTLELACLLNGDEGLGLYCPWPAVANGKQSEVVGHPSNEVFTASLGLFHGLDVGASSTAGMLAAACGWL